MKQRPSTMNIKAPFNLLILSQITKLSSKWSKTRRLWNNSKMLSNTLRKWKQ